MILQPGERPIASEQILWSVGPGLLHGLAEKLQLTNYGLGGSRLSGILYLTNFRLVFEVIARDLTVGYIPKTVLDLTLSQITNAVAVRRADGQAVLSVEAGVQGAHTFATPNAENWVTAIVSSRNTLIASKENQRGTVPFQPTVYLHCKHCGSLNPAGTTRCTSCGATL